MNTSLEDQLELAKKKLSGVESELHNEYLDGYPVPSSVEMLEEKHRRYSGEISNLQEKLDFFKEEVYVDNAGGKERSIIVTDINDEIKKYFSMNPHKLYDLSPRKFEELIADILEDFGFNTEMTPST